MNLGRGIMIPSLFNSQQLMSLQTQSPPRVFKAIVHDPLGVALTVRTIHGLQEEMLEIQRLEPFWLGTCLRKD